MNVIIQNRRGAYANVIPQKLLPGEIVVVNEGDPASPSGQSVYIGTKTGEIQRLAFSNEVSSANIQAQEAAQQAQAAQAEVAANTVLVNTKVQEVATNAQIASTAATNASASAMAAATSATNATTASQTAVQVLDSMAPAYSSSATYNVGDLVIHNNQLYQCITEISTAEAWNQNHWAAVTVENVLTNLEDDVSDTIDEVHQILDDTLDDVYSKLNPVYGAFTTSLVDVEELMDQNGNIIEFPFMRLSDYLTEAEVNSLIAEELGTFNNFEPENYRYNSGVNGYYEYYVLPILYLYGDTSTMTKSQKVNLEARFKDISIGCSCKWQGSSSLAYPKKNYTITFNAPITVKSEWGAKKKYVLKSEFYDSTHTRNTVSAKLWAEIVNDREIRNNTTTLDDESGNPITLENGTTNIDIINSPVLGSAGNGCLDGFHVMVVINDEYHGLYTFGIPKDDWMFGMDNGSENCCIINAEANTNPTKFRSTTTKSAIENEQTFTVEYASDDMNIDRIVTSVNNMLSSVVNATGSNYRSTIEPYFDVDSAIDYFIYSLLIGNWDGISHNYNLATYDGVKWMFSAYDLDNTFGAEDLVNWKFENVFDDPSEVLPNLPITSDINRFFYLIYTYGKDEFKARYQYLRNGIMSENHIFTSFYNHISIVSQRVLSKEYELWPTSPRSGAMTIDAILSFYRLRCAYLDSKVAAL